MAPLMHITFADVAARFDAILAGSMSRGEVDNWAWKMLEAEDAGELVILPSEDHPRVWNGLTYLFGIGMYDLDTNNYQRSDEDLQKAYATISGEPPAKVRTL